MEPSFPAGAAGTVHDTMSNYGTNVGYIDELYGRYVSNPNSVSEAWREFFADYRPQGSCRERRPRSPPRPRPSRRERPRRQRR